MFGDLHAYLQLHIAGPGLNGPVKSLDRILEVESLSKNELF